jgi:hypothetical protein
MATASEIIILALKDAQIIDENEPVSAALMADALTTLNQMLGMWQATDIYIHATTELTIAADSGISYTIGPSGADITATTPDRINYAFLNKDSLNYPMLGQLKTYEEFQEIGITAVIANPDVFFYNNTRPSGTIYIYPQPSSGTLHFGVDVRLPNYALAPDAFTLDIRYEMPVRFNLAKILVAMMGTRLSPELDTLARTSLRQLQRSNVVIPALKLDGHTGQSERSDFYSGYVR